MEKIERIYEYLNILEKSTNEIFARNNIYIAWVDKRFLDDDELWDKYGEDIPCGLRFCFSNHDKQLIIPLDVLKKIGQKAGDCLITFEQNSANHSKPLYLYMNVELSMNVIKHI